MERNGGRPVDQERPRRHGSEPRRIVIVVTNGVECAQRVAVLHPLGPLRRLAWRSASGAVAQEAAESFHVSVCDGGATQRVDKRLHLTSARIIVPMIWQHPEGRRFDQGERAHALRIVEREEQCGDAAMRHSDQVRLLVIGMPDLMLSPWAAAPERKVPLEVWGPEGTRDCRPAFR